MPYQEELPEVISKKDHVSSVKKDNSRLYFYYISKMEFEEKKSKIDSKLTKINIFIRLNILILLFKRQ